MTFGLGKLKECSLASSSSLISINVITLYRDMYVGIGEIFIITHSMTNTQDMGRRSQRSGFPSADAPHISLRVSCGPHLSSRSHRSRLSYIQVGHSPVKNGEWLAIRCVIHRKNKMASKCVKKSPTSPAAR